jgi:nucleotide-binding universal stress UspA family protein
MTGKYYVPNFRKILATMMPGCDTDAMLQVALAIGGESAVRLAGFIPIQEGESLSKGALAAQELRRALHELDSYARWRRKMPVVVSHSPWEELRQMTLDDKPDLLLLNWPHHFAACGATPEGILSSFRCNVGILRGPLPVAPQRILVAVRGGANAELALRLALDIKRHHLVQLTSLHLAPPPGSGLVDSPFRGIDQILDNLPEITRVEAHSDDPARTILQWAGGFDLVIVGAAAHRSGDAFGLGTLAKRLLHESPSAVIVVKSPRARPTEIPNVNMGQSAISVLVDKWFAEKTYHAEEFSDLSELARLKQQRNLTISLALPALNEAETVGNVIQTIRSDLMEKTPIVDEIILVDSDSTDETRAIASSLGVPVFIHQETLPQYGARSGKGEALWKSLYLTQGDIILWIDTDIVNIHPRFIFGLIGPLLANPEVQFVKGFYRRPIKVGDQIQPGGGGRVTELTARPMLNLFFPELSGVIQPLSGEYGGYRSLLERLPFASGYGVEIGLLIDVLKTAGLGAIAQVDLKERVHHNQPIEALSKMSFAIIQTLMHKLETYGGHTLLEDVNLTMKLIRYGGGRLYLDVEEIAELERPPVIQIPEYNQRWSK